MSLYGISKFLFAFNTNGMVRNDFRSNPAATLAAYDLDESERQALAALDFKWLYAAGVHPLQLTALANGSGVPIPRYLEAIRG